MYVCMYVKYIGTLWWESIRTRWTSFCTQWLTPFVVRLTYIHTYIHTWSKGVYTHSQKPTLYFMSVCLYVCIKLCRPGDSIRPLHRRGPGRLCRGRLWRARLQLRRSRGISQEESQLHSLQVMNEWHEWHGWHGWYDEFLIIGFSRNCLYVCMCAFMSEPVTVDIYCRNETSADDIAGLNVSDHPVCIWCIYMYVCMHECTCTYICQNSLLCVSC